MEREQPTRPNAEAAGRMFTSAVDEFSGHLKLYLTLNTGAVGLLVSLLAASHARRLVLVVLFLSIVFFGIAAAICLRLLLELVKFRIVLASAFATGRSVQEVGRRLADWRKKPTEMARLMSWMFNLGIIFAALFAVTGIFLK